MEFSGTEVIAAARDRVWEAINDPEVLRDCIPGCESFERSSATTFTAIVKRKIGPVNARFVGELALRDIRVGEGCVISGEGKGGAAGSASGEAEVTLQDHADGTELAYRAEARVRGKIAQLGSRLIVPVMKKTTEEFFARFREIVGGEEVAAGG